MSSREVGATLRDYRRERGLTLGELAARADIRVGRLACVEEGLERPAPPELSRLADALERAADGPVGAADRLLPALLEQAGYTRPQPGP
jgi:transcriptional regulator with XRE-family HTH domain